MFNGRDLNNALIFSKALVSVPIGMVLNSVFLWQWKVLPAVLGARFPSLNHRMNRFLLIISLITVLSWLLLAVGFVSGVRFLSASLEEPPLADGMYSPPAYPAILRHPSLFAGFAGLAIQIAIGVYNSWHLSAAPRGVRKVTLIQILARGVLAAVAICNSVLLLAPSRK